MRSALPSADRTSRFASQSGWSLQNASSRSSIRFTSWGSEGVRPATYFDKHGVPTGIVNLSRGRVVNRWRVAVPEADRYPGRCSSRRWRSAARPRRRRAAGSRHEHRRRRHTNLPDRAGGSGSGDPSTAPVLGRPRRTKRVRARRRPTHSAQPHCGSVVVQRSPGSATRATARVHAPLPHSTLIGNARMVAPIAGTAVRLASFSICR